MSSTWMKPPRVLDQDVTSNDAKRSADDDLLERPTRNTARSEAGPTCRTKPSACRCARHRGDPDLEVDRNAPKDGSRPGDGEAIPELRNERRSPDEAVRRRNQSRFRPTILKRPGYSKAIGDLHSRPRQLSRPGWKFSLVPVVLDNPQKPLEFPDPAKHPRLNGTNPADSGQMDGIVRLIHWFREFS